MSRATSRLRRAALAAATLLAFAGLGSEAAAQGTRLCRQLEAELASAGTAPNTRQIRRHDDAIARQRDQIRIANTRARNAGCGFTLLGGGRCGPINTQIEKMQRNLEALQRQRANLAGGRGRSRAAIMADLRANGCRQEQARRAVEPARKAQPERSDDNLFDRLFGGGVRRVDPTEKQAAARPEPEERTARRTFTLRDGSLVDEQGRPMFSQPLSGEYRTLCVRTCDGYFFPMSNQASVADFARDQQNCESACPGTEVRVYYHRAEGEESADMVSAVGARPYSDLPTAYRYKDPDAPQTLSCGCNRPAQARGFSVLAGDPSADPKPAEPAEPAATTQPDPSAGGPSSVEAMSDAATPSASTEAGGVERRVRVVGPAFLPDPEAAIDLQAPDRTDVR